MKVIKIIIAITGVMIMVMAHDLGHEIYTSYFRPSSHGVGLGFIRFYMLFVLLPVVFLTPFIANKYTHTLSCIAILYLLFSWGGLHPLRFILMILSFMLSYMSVLFLKKIDAKRK
ncbi:hypothetical protein VEE53_21840 [Escherichia coli]|nr:hypothetical protein VEE53_21840 [Escherichia coli]